MMILKAYFVKFKIFKNKSMIINIKMIMFLVIKSKLQTLENDDCHYSNIF